MTNAKRCTVAILERSHRFMGVGEGTNEIPDQLLEQLRKRTIYYKSQMPQQLKVYYYSKNKE